MAKSKQNINTNQNIEVLQMLTRQALASVLGVSYGGERNLYTALGYNTDPKYVDYLAKYERLDIAKAIIDRPINETWRGDITVHLPEEDNENLKKEWKKLYRKLKLKSNFIKADKLSSIGRYSVLVMGFNDVKNVNLDMQKPIQSNAPKLLYVSAYGEDKALINTYVTNPADERYGLPLLYQITKATETSTSTFLVHYSRVIHITRDCLEGEVFGTPALKAVFNRLEDLEKIVGGSSEMFWRGARPGMTASVTDSDKYSIPPDLKDKLDDQMHEYENNLRRFLIAEGINIIPLLQQVSDPTAHVDVQITMISSQTGIPKRILMGSERGELASSEDKDSWLETIQARREEFAEYSIVRAFVDRLMQLNVLPMVEDYEVEWSDLFAVSEKDKVELGRARASALREYAVEPMAQTLMPPEMAFKLLLGLTQQQVDEVVAWMEWQEQQEGTIDENEINEIENETE